MEKFRADRLLVARGLAKSRAQAQQLIKEGHVRARGQRIERASATYPEDVELSVESAPRFVSRGGDKLEGAISDLDVDVSGTVCLDVGASTGGFTDCLLSRGARKVYAVDVGHDQLAPKLRQDPRVISREGVNARYLEASDFPEAIDLVVVDASFIGLEKLLPALAAVLPPGGRMLSLMKPQFEVGPKEAARSRGVVKDAAIREAAIEKVRRAVREAGFVVLGECDSRVPGEKGNVERFIYGRRGDGL